MKKKKLLLTVVQPNLNPPMPIDGIFDFSGFKLMLI